MHEDKPIETNPEIQREQQDRIIDDLENLKDLIQCHLALANGAEVDVKENGYDFKENK